MLRPSEPPLNGAPALTEVAGTSRALRIALHDLAGHPFSIQLSRELANRGHSVVHLHCPSFEAPKGRLNSSSDDPPTFAVTALPTGFAYKKYNPFARIARERQYARLFRDFVQSYKPDVVLSGNATPLLQNWLRVVCQRRGTCFVAWMQDLWAMGVASVCRRKVGPLGKVVAYPLRRLEATLMTRSDAVVLISDDFLAEYQELRSRAKGPWAVVENWAPLEEIPCRPKSNQWSRAHSLDKKKVFLYSGTLGLKHNPELLIQLAVQFQARDDVVVAVITQGLGRSYLEARKRDLNLSNVRLFDFQPFESLPDVIATADVLVAIIEKDAGRFSVPSKVLSYLCASRPLLLSVPEANLSAKIVRRNQAGVVVEPDDIRSFMQAAQYLIDHPKQAAFFAEHARDYAERTFRVPVIADSFEAVFRQALANRCQ